MNRGTLIGIGLLIVGMIAYGTGIYIEYPGRGFSITAITVGIALVAIRGQNARSNT